MKSNQTVYLYILILLTSLSITACSGSGGSGTSVNFSEYLPLNKGTSFTYRVTESQGTRTFTKVATTGAMYDSLDQRSVRTCESALNWQDIAHMDGGTYLLGFSSEFEDFVNYVVLDKPILIGMENWSIGQSLPDLLTFIPFLAPKLKSAFASHRDERGVKIIFTAIESVTVPAGTFADTMRIEAIFNLGVEEGGPSFLQDGEVIETSWYAKDVGLIKRQYFNGDVFELTSYGFLPDPPPALSAIQPKSGADEGGSLIHLTGEQFRPGAIVTIGGKRASSTFVEGSTALSSFIPSGSLGPADVAVTNPDCQVAILDEGLEYQQVWTPVSTVNAPEPRRGHTAVWTGSEMLVWGGSGASIDNSTEVFNTGGRFDPVTNTWKPMSAPAWLTRRDGHVAVWTGTEMIIWGGSGPPPLYTYNSGARYNPTTDTWTPINNINAPEGRILARAVWTGSEMIVWGGNSRTHGWLNTGGRYNPTNDTWTPLPTVNAPTNRIHHGMVWTGSELIIWGGQLDGGSVADNGGIYNPSSNLWRPTTRTAAPTARYGHVSLWTGTAMLILGGKDRSDDSGKILTSGALYDPLTEHWKPINTEGAPHFYPFVTQQPAVWTGNEVIIWSLMTSLRVGGVRYNPITDSWTTIWTSDAPRTRGGDTVVWTGSKLIVWGGDHVGQLETGGIYDPSIDPNISSSALPSIVSLSPSSGPTEGGTPLLIRGAHFRPDATVTIGGKEVSEISFADKETISVITPAGNPGYVDVMITLPDFPWWKTTARGRFTYTPFSFEGWIGGGTNGWQIGSAPIRGVRDAEFNGPMAIVAHGSALYIADTFNNRLQKWDISGRYIGWIGGGSNGWQTGTAPPSPGKGIGEISFPKGLAIDSDGNIYVAEIGNNRIQKFDASGVSLGWIGHGLDGWQTGEAPVSWSAEDRQFNQPEGVALDGSGNIYVADTYNDRIQKWTPQGVYLGWIGNGINGWQQGPAPVVNSVSGRTNGMFQDPSDVAVDEEGNIYIADSGNGRIQKWVPEGNVVGWIGNSVNGWQTGAAPEYYDGYKLGQMSGLFGFSLDSEGNIYAINSGSHTVEKWDASGNVIGWIGNGQYGWQRGDKLRDPGTNLTGSELGFFSHPQDVAIGADNKLYIVDYFNARIQKWKE